MDELLKWREEFPILANTTYMISNSLGAMPRAVYARMNDYAEAWAKRGVRAWEEGWWDLAITAGDKVGKLIGAGRGEISLHQNVTITEAIVSSCFDFSGPRNKVVMVDLEFPSIIYFYLEQRRRGARVSILKSEDGIHAPLDQLLASIDETTLLVPISLVLFRSATIVDARAIVEKAHSVGAMVILDCFQAAGTIPVDVRGLNVDFAVGGCLKWLCGGPGIGYLYVRPDLRKKLSPTLTGWSAHRRPFEFEVGAVEHARGFVSVFEWHAACSGALCLPAGVWRFWRRSGIEKIREKSKRQTQRLMDGALARGWKVNSPRDPEERGGTISVECPHAKEVKSELIARDVLVDYRPAAGVRLSPHFYNRDEELDFALAQMEEILATRAWERHLQPV